MPLRHYQADAYSHLLTEKKQQIQRQLSSLYDKADIEVHPSRPHSFRMRAEFRIWHQDDELFYAMFTPENKKIPVRVEHFPIASQAIQNVMPELLKHIKASKLLREKLFQAEFLSSQTGQVLVSLIYHKNLPEAWLEPAKQLEQDLGIFIIGRSRKQKRIVSQDYIEEELNVDGKIYYYRQYENGFTQPNAGVNEQMLAWASQQLQGSQGDLLELYCGNGNFTCVLAQHFDKVLATEISKTSVHCAHHNFSLNGNNNIQIARMSSEEFTQALTKVRSFRRLANIDLNNYQFSTLLVDPPRAGLDPQTLVLARRFETILYISCNPDTLVTNIRSLSPEYQINNFAIFDQFPYTHHLECGALLSRKASAK